MQENIILNKSINFSVGVKNYCQALYFKKDTAIANQLIRCGMAIGANVSEAQQAESRSDFIHKMKTAAKEASESLYWLSVCEKTDIAGFQHELISEVNQIIAILSRMSYQQRKISNPIFSHYHFLI
jgi:four helix bundle protein